MVSAAFFAFGLLAISGAYGKPVTEDPLSANELSRVIDAAVTRLSAQGGWWHKMTTKHEFTNALVVSSCTPDDAKWKWPETVGATGLWKRVLDSGKLKVAGVKWSQGMVADYKTNPLQPTGFWPEYLKEMVDRINLHYGTTIKIERVYFPTSVLVIDAVAKGDVDMSEPYYYLAGFHTNDPRIEALHISCVTLGTEGNFITRNDSGITELADLFTKIQNGPVRDVGFIAEGNANSVKSILPTNHFPKIGLTNGTDVEDQVVSGSIIAGYISEGFPSLPERFNLVPTGIISPRVAFFRKDEPSCDGDKTVTKTEDGLIVGVFMMALAVVILVAILSTVIIREKRGHPIFSPLLSGQNPPSNI